MLDSEIEYVKMAETESSLWWYQNLHLLAIDQIQKLSRGDKSVRILDIACGTGGLMLKLKGLGFENVEGVDLSEHAIKFCQINGLNVTRLNLKDISELKDRPKYDFVICNDGLCYLEFEEKKAFLRDLNLLIAPLGYFMANEAALKMFGGTHDYCVGILERVDTKLVNKVLEGSSFKMMKKIFWPFFLSPMIYLVRLKQRLLIKKGHFKKTPMESDVSMPHPVINLILFLITRLENLFLPAKPFGSSLFWIAQLRPLSKTKSSADPL